jgi:DNA-binding MarR family transcriptional regulator
MQVLGTTTKRAEAGAPDIPAERAWRALMRAVLVIPRLLEADLLETHGLNPSEYSVLQHLSEAPERSLRMTQLANYVLLSGSGLTRMVERLTRQGLVERVRSESDGRGQCAVLTLAGLQRLQEAWPTHVCQRAPPRHGSPGRPRRVRRRRRPHRRRRRCGAADSPRSARTEGRTRVRNCSLMRNTSDTGRTVRG